jgi:drug/metabolite transporter (DMT)-like permease
MITAVLLTATPTSGYSGRAYFWILIVTLLTQFLGHIPINFSLRYFHATTISLFMQISVVAAGVVAFLLFQEVPTFLQLLGSGAIIFGVLLATQRQITSRVPTPV